MRKIRRLGFTLIEAMVIVAVIGLLAAAIAPNVVGFVRAQEERTFESRLESMSSLGREKAISLAKPVDLQFDSSTTSFSLHSTDANGSDETLGSALAAPKGLNADRFMLGTQESDASSWKMTFYPDGSADGGGVQLDQGNYNVSLVVDARTGTSDILQNQLPDASTLTWTAGDYVHRATS